VRIALRGFGHRLQAQARLARPARPGQREQAHALLREQPGHLLKFPLPPQEGRGRDGQVRLVQARKRRELLLSELVEALGRRQVLEPVLAQVDK
jgi:hypothetical protein